MNVKKRMAKEKGKVSHRKGKLAKEVGSNRMKERERSHWQDIKDYRNDIYNWNIESHLIITNGRDKKEDKSREGLEEKVRK